MRIAMIGQKGIPATWGGVERHVEELSAVLAARGHEVVVYTRPRYTPPSIRECRGARLRSVGTIPTKHFDAFVHSLLATVLSARGFDVIHYHGIGPALMTPLARLSGAAVVVTVHGQDWRRAKWGRGAAAVLRLGETAALRFAHVTISVSRTLAERYRADGAHVAYVPNGVVIPAGEDRTILDEWQLTPGRYLLFAGRLVPEKGLHYLIEAHRQLGTDVPLVVAGDSSHSDDYVAEMKATAGPGVLFVDYQYGERLSALMKNAGLFVLPSDLEGLPIVLLEALASGTPVLASDIAPNVEVLGDQGAYFTAGDSASLRDALAVALSELGQLKARSLQMRETALREYEWERVGALTEAVYGCAIVRKRDRTHRCAQCDIGAKTDLSEAVG